MQASKLLGGLMLPLPVVLFLLTVGFVLAAGKRRRCAGRVLTLSGLLLLCVVSAPGVGERALYSLENTYPLLYDIPREAGWIVVLGGGVRFEDGRPAAARLGEGSLYRLMEGVRLARALPGARLVVSGYRTAGVMAELAGELGVERGRVVVSGAPRNTYQEARAVAGLAGAGRTVILVTSASHMRRAAALFEGQGLVVVPAPTGHRAEAGVRRDYLVSWLPRAGNIVFAETVLREGLGLAWARLRGWTGRG